MDSYEVTPDLSKPPEPKPKIQALPMAPKNSGVYLQVHGHVYVIKRIVPGFIRGQTDCQVICSNGTLAESDGKWYGPFPEQ